MNTCRSNGCKLFVEDVLAKFTWKWDSHYVHVLCCELESANTVCDEMYAAIMVEELRFPAMSRKSFVNSSKKVQKQ